MSFREKIHWVTLGTMIAAFGWYFLAYPWGLAASPAGLWASAGMLLPVTIAIIVAMTIASAWMAIRTPAEANLNEDERDRSIHYRGTHYAYYPLVVGVWVSIFALFWNAGPAVQLNLLLAAVVLAELTRIGVQLYLYRRGY
ncbi:hypothetical protein [Sphingopyxis terrae]|uniref:DUF2178 domain-containing protein n=1 Tax=Sphingopyxis terrae subsp. ummariensis TaxID=429001 RepID=A0A1Y6FVK6_9SPHN|nr:hypothetical protein [Sphingopyxis terrae]PCF91902.1 hypothetical protein CPA46_09405 [Sphingopyxis terrae subsp. ummariensis]SMQ76872.1 hypothetical protein SAMN06295984_2294 [Sphingopyxis terrae subsp. ummariensis]